MTKREIEVVIKVKVDEPEFDERGLPKNLVLRPSISMGEGSKEGEKVTFGRSWNESHFFIGYKKVDFIISFTELIDAILNKFLSEKE